ncbi:Uncharacterised protein [Mycolicibacterium vanbaalenii]|uniref:ESX-1 secretion-associated protein n=1 Tax=Mycolicibacterium vanbaalenii TaxID=110539 RepID=A0A5S9QYA7_MYCVN|nr:type VII secretion target [Mycolicibacterium vanbaalenii]CAA0124369.1 Uncharacterised protein [Mycolicibacterium vanbaalenii]
MSGASVQVTTAHLRALAARHGLAAGEFSHAGDSVFDVDAGIRASHGTVAWPTARAVEAIQQARRDAAASVADQSRSLGDTLTAAAGCYETTDFESGRHLEELVGREVMSPAPRLWR